MNTYNIDNEEFLNSDIYKRFLDANKGSGNLGIRAYAASGAVPISGMEIIVSTIFENNRIIFFSGVTDSSGVIEKITLPAPISDENNLEAPTRRVYQLEATLVKDNISDVYDVNIYDGICTMQNIKVTPNMNLGGF